MVSYPFLCLTFYERLPLDAPPLAGGEDVTIPVNIRNIFRFVKVSDNNDYLVGRALHSSFEKNPIVLCCPPSMFFIIGLLVVRLVS